MHANTETIMWKGGRRNTAEPPYISLSGCADGIASVNDNLKLMQLHTLMSSATSVCLHAVWPQAVLATCCGAEVRKQPNEDSFTHWLANIYIILHLTDAALFSMHIGNACFCHAR